MQSPASSKSMLTVVSGAVPTCSKRLLAVRSLSSSDALFYGDWLPVRKQVSGTFWKCCVRSLTWPWRFPAARRWAQLREISFGDWNMSARQGCYSSLQYLLVGYGISGLVVVARKPRTGCRPRRRVSAMLGVCILAASIFCGAAYVRGATEPIWPTKEWQTSSPEEQGMDSKELANVVDFGAAHNFDSLLVVRHGKIVAEVYYAPYTAGIPHAIYSATKAIISTLIGIATKDGLLDSPSHRALDFFDRGSIANVDDRKEAITVQSLLDMTSGLEWAEPLGGMPRSMFEMERNPYSVTFILARPLSGVPGDAFSYNSRNR